MCKCKIILHLALNSAIVSCGGWPRFVFFLPNKNSQAKGTTEIMVMLLIYWSIRVAERLAVPTSDHGVAGSNPAGGEMLPEPKRRFTAQSHSFSPFHRLEMTEILLKERKILTHPFMLLI